jgi:hypothetical protein
MKIKLVRTGGFIPIKKAAEAEANLTDQEFVRLLVIIKRDPSAPKIKDGHYYELTAGSACYPIDIEKVPPEYEHLFQKLKNELKTIKEP